MACGCNGGKLCSCTLNAGAGISISGIGSPANPYIITNTGAVAPTPAFPNIPLPQDLGLQAWNFPPSEAGQADFILTSGQLNLVALYVHTPFTTNGMVINLLNSSSQLISGQNFLGLYSFAGNLVAKTADLTSAWSGAATGGTKYPWATPVLLPIGSYWGAFLSNNTGTGVGVATGLPLYLTPPAFGFLAPAQYPIAINGSGQTALPATITPSANTQGQLTFWTALY